MIFRFEIELQDFEGKDKTEAIKKFQRFLKGLSKCSPEVVEEFVCIWED